MAQTSVENFFRGQTVRIVVASGPAGGFDTFARLLARHLSRFVPGNPTFVVQNMPGAGGLRAAGYIAKVAPRDGLTIGAVQGGMVKAPLIGLTGADYDSTTMRWIGNLNSEVHVCVAWHTSGITTIQQAMEKELIVGASTGADSELAPHAFNNFLGTKFKIIPGYQDGPRILLAMQRAEVLGRCGWSWSSVVSQHPEWYRDKTVRVLTQWPTRHADLTELSAGAGHREERRRQAGDRLPVRPSCDIAVVCPAARRAGRTAGGAARRLRRHGQGRGREGGFREIQSRAGADVGRRRQRIRRPGLFDAEARDREGAEGGRDREAVTR